MVASPRASYAPPLIASHSHVLTSSHPLVQCRDRPDFAAEAELTRLEGPKPTPQADWEACPNCGDSYGAFAMAPHTRRCIKLFPNGRNGFGSGPPPAKGFFEGLFGPDEIAEQTGLSADEIARLRKIFDRFDASKNGTLEAPELVKLLRECFPARAAEASNLLAEFQIADANGDGRCDFGEFCRYYVVLNEDFGTSGMSDEEMMKLRVLFQRFDEVNRRSEASNPQRWRARGAMSARLLHGRTLTHAHARTHTHTYSYSYTRAHTGSSALLSPRRTATGSSSRRS